MKKRKIYIFTATSKASDYGIGTYIDNLIKVLQSSNLEFGLVHLHSEGNEVNIVQKDGYEQIEIPYPVTSSKNAEKYYARNVIYILKEFIPDSMETEYIFHLNFMKKNILIQRLRKSFFCKIILVVHYTQWSFSLLGDFRKLKTFSGTNPEEKYILKNIKDDLNLVNRADKMICVSTHTFDTFKKQGKLKHKQAEIINNALEDRFLQTSQEEKTILRKKYHISETEKVILFAGRLDEVKGVKYLISAFKDVLSKNPDTRLLIAGSGNYDELLKESSNCWSKINFTGKLDKKTLYDLYRIVDAGVVCSLHEEFGLVAIEMMMNTLPIIVTQTSGLNEIVEDGISGLKVPVRIRKGERQVDVKILSEKIKFLLDNPETGKILGKNARKRFLEKYELSLFKEKMLNLYQTI